MALTFTPLPELGKTCPDFNLIGVDGKHHSLSEFLNAQPLVVMFICNHCPYVKAIEDRLIQLGHDCKNLGINLIAICSNDPKDNHEDSFESLQKRSIEKKYPFLYLHDPDQKTAEQFEAVCTPDFFIFDQNQSLAYRGRLDDSWKDADKVTKRELYESLILIQKQLPLTSKQIPSMGCNIKWSHS